MTQLSLIPQTKSEEEKNRQRLLVVIKKRRLVLQKIVVRNEMLKVRLDMLKREYMVKIGSLIVKDNHLDLEIMQLRNIVHLMEEGKTYKEAADEIASTFYAEQLEIEREQENVYKAEKIFEKGRLQKSEEEQADAKKLWRRLISLFHPDLTQDVKEKKIREELMKQINLAYEEGDLSRLSSIERDHTITPETTATRLEDMISQLETEIIEQDKQYVLLKESEWYRWHLKIAKAKHTLEDIFSSVERNLLNTIVAKIDIVKELQRSIEKIEPEAAME